MASADTFNDLIQRVRTCDNEAAKQLLDRFGRCFFRMIRNKLEIRGYSEPLIQQILEELYNAVWGTVVARLIQGQYELQDSNALVNLLHSIASNKLADMERRRMGEEPPEEPPDPEPRPSSVLATLEEMAAARDLMSEEEWRILVLHELEKASWMEIASELGGTPDQRRKQCERACARVRKGRATGEGKRQ
jgi:DNA-directed RNA polymerase specialized sigma24 family protein